MAGRPIFIPFTEGDRLVKEIHLEFSWNPGFAPVQKKKNITALHAAAEKKGIGPILEVSSKSDLDLGFCLSAFNLPVELDDGSRISLECAFQGSKVFLNGGPYRDIFWMTSREAKKDERIRSSGPITGFKFEGTEFPSEPKTAFYDWLYVKALAGRRGTLQELEKFAGFSDIEFNPAKSINCQARSCALAVSLFRKNLIEQVIKSPTNFISAVKPDSLSQPYSDDLRQGRLL